MLRPIRACVKNQKGAAFLLTLLVFVVLLALGVGILGMSASNVSMSEADRTYQAVYYIAESGRDRQVAGIREVIGSLSQTCTGADEFYTALDAYFQVDYPMAVTGFDDQYGQETQSVVSIEGIGTRPDGASSYIYTLVSEGSIGAVRRQVVSDLSVAWTETQADVFDTDMALFTMQGIKLTGSSRVVGPVGTNSSAAGALDFEWSTSITGNLYIPSGVDPAALIDTDRPGDTDNIGGNIVGMANPRTYELPPYPDVPSLPLRSDIALDDNHPICTISQDGHYKKISSISHALTVDVGNGVRRLVVDEFSFGGDANGCVNIVGSGLLEIYVTGTFTLSGTTRFNPSGDRDRVMLYYGGTDPFIVGADTYFVGNVYVKEADIDITSSKGITGHIVSGGASVDITGDASAYVRVIYAPKAFVQLKGSGHVTGAVIARSCYLEGDTYINYRAEAGEGGIPIEGFGPDGAATVAASKPIERDY